ncbi:MAG TPA: hypothetical protein VJC07_05535 [Candidatus Nanoarchaeia archaeon]|nr:hypothetical protein [Candidatus Nanoarchaeia archaeon]
MAEKDDLAKQLMKSSIDLQDKNIQLIDSVSKLTKKVDELLTVFEEAARNIEKGEVEEPLARKLNVLLEQNKAVARGLVLIEKYVRDKTSVGFSPGNITPKQLPKTEI